MANAKSLKTAAKELNDVLGLNPPIPLSGVTKDEMIQKMMEGIVLIDPKLDEFSEETEEVIAELKKEFGKKEAPAPKGKPVKKEEPVEEPEETEEEEPEEEETEEEKPTAKKEPKTKVEKQKKTEEKTRATVMRDILLSGPHTMREMKEEMHRRYGGSENEAAFQVGIFVRLLMALDLVEATDGNKLQYTGTYNK